MTLRGQLARIRDSLFPRPCAKKVRYSDRWAADGVRRERQPQEPAALHVYLCPHCGGWHLTKMAQVAEDDLPAA